MGHRQVRRKDIEIPVQAYAPTALKTVVAINGTIRVLVAFVTTNVIVLLGMGCAA